MDKTKVSALLGRPLTPYEDTNFELYLNIAKENLGQLLCMDICSSEDPRVFNARDGYTTVFTDVFRDIDEVKLNGTVVTNYSKRQWDKRSAKWYNSIVFEHKLCADDEVEISANWGFNKMPLDLQQIIAGLFGLITQKNNQDTTISSKQVEDFRISFDVDADIDQSFEAKYAKTIAKYSLCNIPYVRHGGVSQC